MAGSHAIRAGRAALRRVPTRCLPYIRRRRQRDVDGIAESTYVMVVGAPARFPWRHAPVIRGEPPRTRTENLAIKSRLLCH
jgi:hypothetical protein